MFDSIKKDILSWKRKYGNIYYIKIGSNIYVYRTLTRGEYFDVLSLQSTIYSDISDIVLELCLLYPKYDKVRFDSILAGEIDSLVKKIIGLSGFSNGELLLKDIDVARNKVGILDNQIVLLICKAFPQLTPKDINNLNYHDLINYLTLAEAILDTQLKIEKPNDQNKIDFEQENKTIPGVQSTPEIKRGDVTK